MKYLSIFYIVYFVFPFALFATEQLPDLLIHEGKIYELRDDSGSAIYPLANYYQGKNKEMPKFSQSSTSPGGVADISTACHRGYVAIWEIEDKQLFLKGIRGFIVDEKVDMRKMFSKDIQKNRVPAFWYSGRIRLPIGRVVQHHFMERYQVHEKWLLLDIKEGKVMEKETEIATGKQS